MVRKKRTIFLNCALCKKAITKRPSELRKNNFCSVKCHNNFPRKPTKLFASIEFLKSEHLDKKKSCNQIAEELGLKSSRSVIINLNKAGIEIRKYNINRNGKGRKEGQHLSLETKNKIGKSNTKELDMEYIEKEYLLNLRSGVSLGKELGVNSETIRQRLKKKGIMLRGTLSYQHEKPNKPESIMQGIIKKSEIGFSYVGGGTRWFKKGRHSFNPDFIDEKNKLIIEVFGDYWHNKEYAQNRDIERLSTYQEYGFKTIFIWEHELKNVENVTKKIKEFVENARSNNTTIC